MAQLWSRRKEDSRSTMQCCPQLISNWPSSLSPQPRDSALSHFLFPSAEVAAAELFSLHQYHDFFVSRVLRVEQTGLVSSEAIRKSKLPPKFCQHRWQLPQPRPLYPGKRFSGHSCPSLHMPWPNLLVESSPYLAATVNTCAARPSSPSSTPLPSFSEFSSRRASYQSPFTKALENSIRERYKDIGGISEGLQSLEKQTWLRWVFFVVGTVGLLIKLMAMQGMLWTKAWDYMFLFAFLVTDVAALFHRRSITPSVCLSLPEIHNSSAREAMWSLRLTDTSEASIEGWTDDYWP